MKYINQQDYEYIMNKYHDVSEPFDGHNRFLRHDEIFSSDSGLAPESILVGIVGNDKQYESLPHPIRKARALEYVLKNTRISCDERDIFPAINMIDRPLSQTIIKAWRKDVFGEMIPRSNQSADSWSVTASLRSGPITITAFPFGIGYFLSASSAFWRKARKYVQVKISQ